MATVYKPSLLYLGFLTLPFSPSFFPPSHLPSPRLPTPPIYAYNMPIQLLYRPALHYVHLYRLCYLSNSRFRYRCSTMLTLKMKKTAVTLSHVHTNIEQIRRTIDVEQCGFEPCRCYRPASQRRAIGLSPAALF